MLAREVVKEFLQDKLTDWEVELSKSIDLNELVEAFCLYVEDDYYEWLKDNAESFFTVGSDGVDWNIIRGRMKKYQVK